MSPTRLCACGAVVPAGYPCLTCTQGKKTVITLRCQHCNRLAGEITDISDLARLVYRWKCHRCEQWNERTVEHVATAA